MSTSQVMLSRLKAELRSRMVEIRGEIDRHMAPAVVLRAQLDAKIAEQNALSKAIADLVDQVDAIEQPRLRELKQELASIARAEIAIQLEH